MWRSRRFHDETLSRNIVRQRTIAPIQALAARQLLLFRRRHLLDQVVRDAHAGHDLVVEHPHAAGGDRAHRQLLVPGDAELAHEKHVQGRAERPGHFVRDGDAAARQGQHEHVRPIGVGAELGREQAPRFGAITKAP